MRALRTYILLYGNWCIYHLHNEIEKRADEMKASVLDVCVPYLSHSRIEEN